MPGLNHDAACRAAWCRREDHHDPHPRPVWKGPGPHDRRPRVEVNQLGRHRDTRPRYTDQLDTWTRLRYDAQLEAWLAGSAFCLAAQKAATYGAPVPQLVRERWDTARDFLWWVTGMEVIEPEFGGDPEPHYRPTRTVTAREDLL